jgi:hypothetical protein
MRNVKLLGFEFKSGRHSGVFVIVVLQMLLELDVTFLTSKHHLYPIYYINVFIFHTFYFFKSVPFIRKLGKDGIFLPE